MGTGVILADARRVHHQMRNGVLLHQRTHEMRLRTNGVHGDFVATVSLFVQWHGSFERIVQRVGNFCSQVRSASVAHHCEARAVSVQHACVRHSPFVGT